MVTFGVFLELEGLHYATVKQLALEAEKLGYHSFSLNDHLLPTLPPYDRPQLECWTTISALATVTKKIRLGPLVTCVTFRYPSLVAKMSATLDVISNGRLDFGIGAGWYEKEHVTYGLNFPSIEERFERLREAILLTQKMWTEQKATFSGKYYYVKNAYNNPKPIQKPHPPIIVEVSGEKLAFKVAAELANVCNIHTINTNRSLPPYLTPKEYARKLDILASYAEDAGRSPAHIKKSVIAPIIMSKDKNDLRRLSEKIGRKRKIPRKYLDQWAIIGKPDEVSDAVTEYVKAGAQHFNAFFPSVEEITPLRQFALEVIPFTERLS